MIYILRVFLLLLTVLTLASCKSESKPVPVFVDAEANTDDDSDFTDNAIEEDVSGVGAISIPYKSVGGIKTVSVKINDIIGVDMIVDTGCSGALISLSEAKYLAEKGALTKDDIIGTQSSVIADGSIVENAVVRLRKLTIGDKLTATDVNAIVSNNIQAPLLLGNEVLNRVRSMSIDNENHCIVFQLK